MIVNAIVNGTFPLLTKLQKHDPFTIFTILRPRARPLRCRDHGHEAVPGVVTCDLSRARGGDVAAEAGCKITSPRGRGLAVMITRGRTAARTARTGEAVRVR